MGHGQVSERRMDGLEGITVAATELSDVDGEHGRLVLGGYPVEELAGRVSFETLCGLLWSGRLPEPDESASLRRQLGLFREQAFRTLEESLGGALKRKDGMDALRAAMAQGECDTESWSAAAPLMVAAAAVYAAAWYRLSRGEKPIAPDPRLGLAEDYLRMLTGAAPRPPCADALETYLVTVSDHGMNASTFAARVVASTGSDLVSAIVAGIGALKGPLHGGAPGPVLDMLDAIASVEAAPQWLERRLGEGQRIMGMGHRIYRVRDPRASVLEWAVERLEKAGISTGRLRLARAVEQSAHGLLRKKYPERNLAANVEFYTAVLLDTIGIPRELFSPTFAVGRMVGWCAHYGEQRRTGRLIRPASQYIGPLRSLKAQSV